MCVSKLKESLKTNYTCFQYFKKMHELIHSNPRSIIFLRFKLKFSTFNKDKKFCEKIKQRHTNIQQFLNKIKSQQKTLEVKAIQKVFEIVKKH